MSVQRQDLIRLEWTVRALAQEASVQVTLFPSFVCVADELALDFDEALRRAFPGRDGANLTVLPARVREAFGRLDGQLEKMSGPERLHLWEDEALENEPAWVDVRVAARHVLQTMGWTDAPPPLERAVYIGSDA